MQDVATRIATRTDFCVVAFPKCGTTAMASMLMASPALHLAKASGRFESPFFNPDMNAGEPDYRPDRLNGHKYSAYIYSVKLLQRIVSANPKTLLIVMVRDAGAALLSWRQMHQQMARKNTADHFTTRDEITRSFYAEAPVEAYYEQFADNRLEYADAISTMLRFLPAANFVVVSQRQLGEAPREVMSCIHRRLGVRPDPRYLEGLSVGYKPKGIRDPGGTGLCSSVLKALEKKNEKLLSLVATFDPSNVLLGPDCQL